MVSKQLIWDARLLHQAPNAGNKPFLPSKPGYQPTAALLPGGEDNKDNKANCEASEPPAAFPCFRHLLGSQQLTNLKPCSVTSSFCQEQPNLSCFGKASHIKHSVSQKSVLEERKQPGHHPLQDPSDQLALLRGKQGLKERAEQCFSAGDRRPAASSTIFQGAEPL